jgi:HAD superfamily hydrolase (TIGR01509 family)
MPALDLARFEALLFDLDGVVTRTAAVPARAWKRTFDELLEELAGGAPWQPFDEGRESRAHVDGKPRRDGIRSFLGARGIALPEGAPGDGPGAHTVHGLAARKNRQLLGRLAEDGVEVYPDAVRLLARGRACGLATAVVSSSETCEAGVAAADLTSQFQVRVDGVDIARHGLRGKPAPDTFLEAAARLAVAPRRAAVLEDAIAGVAAGRAGGFGLVIGVDRADQAAALRRAGADIVVATLDEIELICGPGARAEGRELR